MLTNPNDIDPLECEDCVLYREPCPFHQGYAAGFDDTSAIVGQFIELIPKAERP